MGTSDKQDIRWKQRFENYNKALGQLTKFIEKGDPNELEEQGLIQAFEYTHELAWKLMKDYFVHQGNPNITGSRDASREAFGNGLVRNGDGWMEMIKSRNLSSHTYNESVSRSMVNQIKNTYHQLFVDFQQEMEKRKREEG